MQGCSSEVSSADQCELLVLSLSSMLYGLEAVFASSRKLQSAAVGKEV